MKAIKQNISGIVLCAFEILVGILLMIDPVGFTSGIITAVGIVLMLNGLIYVMKYFRMDVEKATASRYLAKGLAVLLAGVFCAVKSDWFIVTFPVLTIIYGVVILIAGLCKMQITVDMLRVKNKKWFLGLISTAVTIVCAVIILDNPFSSTVVLWKFTGITLIIEAALDAVVLIADGRRDSEWE